MLQVHLERKLIMKNISIALMSIAISLLLVRYNPYVSRKLMAEYITSAYFSFKSGNVKNSKQAEEKHKL
jgi:hypothetical protein